MMLAFEGDVEVAIGRMGVEMGAVTRDSKPGEHQASVRYTQEDLLQVELAPEEVSAAMRQDSFTSKDVETWFEAVRFRALQALAEM